MNSINKTIKDSALFGQTASLGVFSGSKAGSVVERQRTEKETERNLIQEIFNRYPDLERAATVYFETRWKEALEHHIVLRFSISLINAFALFGSRCEISNNAKDKYLPGRGYRLDNSQSFHNFRQVDACHSSLTPGLKIANVSEQEQQALRLFNNTAVALPQVFNVRLDAGFERGGGRRSMEDHLRQCCERTIQPCQAIAKLVSLWQARLNLDADRFAAEMDKTNREDRFPLLLCCRAIVYTQHCLQVLSRASNQGPLWARVVHLEVPQDRIACRQALLRQTGSLEEGLSGAEGLAFTEEISFVFRQAFLPQLANQQDPAMLRQQVALAPSIEPFAPLLYVTEPSVTEPSVPEPSVPELICQELYLQTDGAGGGAVQTATEAPIATEQQTPEELSPSPSPSQELTPVAPQEDQSLTAGELGPLAERMQRLALGL